MLAVSEPTVEMKLPLTDLYKSADPASGDQDPVFGTGTQDLSQPISFPPHPSSEEECELTNSGPKLPSESEPRTQCF